MIDDAGRECEEARTRRAPIGATWISLSETDDDVVVSTIPAIVSVISRGPAIIATLIPVTALVAIAAVVVTAMMPTLVTLVKMPAAAVMDKDDV
jgi:hypothetical protein